jgi:hypothetical protein
VIYDVPVPPRPPGFIHVDLDGLWTLADCYGFAEGDSYERDPVYEKALPRMLDLFDRLGLKATFFLIGRDLELPAKAEAAREIVRRGHDLGNHTWHHPFGLEQLPPERLRDEIERAQDILRESTGCTPVGFRAPGYDAGPRVLELLASLGFRYDGSMLPTHWAPALRFSARRLRGRVQEARRRMAAGGGVPASPSVAPPEAAGQYGPGSGGPWGLAPRLFRPTAGGPPIVRFPLAVSPTLRLPLHASLGMLLGRSYVTSGLARLAAHRWPMTYLLHGLDLTAPDEFTGGLPPELAGSRVFNIPLAQKQDFLVEVLERFAQLTGPELTSRYLERTSGEADPPGP